MDISSQSSEQAVSATGFDYSSVPDGEQVRAAAERIKDRRYRIVEDMIEIGRELISVKKMLEHAQFEKWLDVELGWSRASARNFMHVATYLGDKTTTVMVLPPTAIYALAAPSLPDEVRQEVVERLERGEKFDVGQIKQLAKQAKHHVHTTCDPVA